MSEITNNLNGKRLLILGGTPQQLKLVEAAHNLGVYVIVADWLETSIIKRAADAAYALDIKDVDGICELCRKQSVDGVICGWVDPAQRPYQQVCQRLDVPCYGTAEQFRLMTDKKAFKAMCSRSGVDVNPSWTEEEAIAGLVEFPVFVKPVDSRGSRGQAICYDLDQLMIAVATAKHESSDGGVIIERYMGGCQEFQVTYFFENGHAHLVRTADSYTGSEGSGLEKVVLGAVSPSRYTQLYLDKANDAVVRMFKSMGYTDGPVFMQGFVDGDTFRFFDPGLRFPGVDYERVYKKVLGIDLAEIMVRFALTGAVTKSAVANNGVWLAVRAAAVLFPTIKPGIVGSLNCIRAVSDLPCVEACIPRVVEGDEVSFTCDVNQRLAEIDVVANDYCELANAVDAVQKMLDIRNDEDEPMIFELFDTDVLRSDVYAYSKNVCEGGVYDCL